MKRHWYLIITLSIIGCFILSISLTRKHWCSKLTVSKILLSDEALNEAALYQCKDESLIVWLQKDGKVLDVLAVYSSNNKIGGTNSSNFIKFKSGVFSWEMPFNSVILGEVAGKNDEIKPQLLVESDYIEFSPNAPHSNEKVKVIK